MSRANVLYKNKCSCFSSITNSFITKPMSERKYEKWRKKEYGNAYHSLLDNSNFITIEEAVNSICLHREYREAINVLKTAKLLDKYTQGLIIDFYLQI